MKGVEQYNEQKKSIMQLIKEGTSSSIDIMKVHGTLSLDKIIGNDDLKSMRRLATEYTQEKVINGISLLLSDASKSFDKVWSVSKADECANEIYFSEYFYLSLEDIYVVLKECKDYDAIFTPASFRKRLRIYAEKRSAAAENRNYNQYLSQKFSRPPLLISEAAETMQKIKVELYKKKMSDERT